MLWRGESPWHLQPNRNRPGVRVRVGESAHECDEHRLGAYAVACGAAGRVGGTEEGRFLALSAILVILTLAGDTLDRFLDDFPNREA